MRRSFIPALAVTLGVAAPVLAASFENSNIPAFRAATVSLTKAVDLAEHKDQGRAVNAAFTVDSGRGEYVVEVEKGDSVVRTVIDAASSSVLRSGPEGLLSSLFKGNVPAEAFANARTTLGEAIGTAEGRAGGKAVSVEADQSGNTLQYQVSVLVGNQTQTVKIDGANGSVVSSVQQ